MLKGVHSVAPGYAGGPPAGGGKPSYEDVSSGKTGHAEVIRIEYDPAQISFETLLTVFFGTHDPTTPNQQGADRGTQYRSIILSTSEAQKRSAEEFIAELNASARTGAKIVTEVKALGPPAGGFYEAEEYHKNYYAQNPYQPYCQVVINPKLKKVQEKFAELLKGSGQ
jgi:peptide-methionine (S)-S-oxide reductase